MSKRNVKLYKIYFQRTDFYNGFGTDGTSKEFLDYQYAVSSKQAVARYAYKNKIKFSNIIELAGDGCEIRGLIAEEVKNNERD